MDAPLSRALSTARRGAAMNPNVRGMSSSGDLGARKSAHFPSQDRSAVMRVPHEARCSAAARQFHSISLKEGMIRGATRRGNESRRAAT